MGRPNKEWYRIIPIEFIRLCAIKHQLYVFPKAPQFPAMTSEIIRKYPEVTPKPSCFHSPLIVHWFNSFPRSYPCHNVSDIQARTDSAVNPSPDARVDLDRIILASFFMSYIFHLCYSMPAEVIKQLL